MGRDFFEASAEARRVFERANEVLGFDIAKVCFEGPAEQLERTDIQQPAIFTTSAAIWEAWCAAGGGRDEFACAGGLSLGEYTALYAAGAVSFDDALRLVQRRGALMHDAAQSPPSGMVCLVGGDEEKADAVCLEAAQGDVLAPANFNCPGQIVIAGTKAACARAVAACEKFGLRAVPLAVGGAFHTALMGSAAEGLAPVLAQTMFTSPRIPVISNVDARYHGDADAIRRAMGMQVTHPVRWQACIERMVADGVSRFVEIGPGRVLTGLMRKIDRNVATVNVSSIDALSQAAVS